MALRSIIHIDEDLCDGCGACVPSCAEGALQIVDGKARLVADVLCDGLGACLGECPTGALTVISRDAVEFDEGLVAAHLETLGQSRIPRAHAPVPPVPAIIPMVAAPTPASMAPSHGGCPGSRMQVLAEPPAAPTAAASEPSSSRLRQWPVQLHLVPPDAPFFRKRDVLLAADCVPVAVGDFHTSFLDGRGLAIACPKLDSHLEVYAEKLTAMIDHAGIRSLTVAIMEVPCCGGLIRLAQQAMARASRPVPFRVVTIGIRGQVLADRTH